MHCCLYLTSPSCWSEGLSLRILVASRYGREQKPEPTANVRSQDSCSLDICFVDAQVHRGLTRHAQLDETREGAALICHD